MWLKRTITQIRQAAGLLETLLCLGLLSSRLSFTHSVEPTASENRTRSVGGFNVRVPVGADSSTDFEHLRPDFKDALLEIKEIKRKKKAIWAALTDFTRL